MIRLEPKGTRIFGPVFRELKARGLPKDYFPRSRSCIIHTQEAWIHSNKFSIMKIHTNDTKSLSSSGKDKGKKAVSYSRVYPSENKVIVEGVNIVTRHMKKQGKLQDKKLHFEKPINVSNVMLVDPKDGKPTRVGYLIENGKKVRIAKNQELSILKKPFTSNGSPKSYYVKSFKENYKKISFQSLLKNSESRMLCKFLISKKLFSIWVSEAYVAAGNKDFSSLKNDLALIAGQLPRVNHSRIAISNFKLRKECQLVWW
jgi:large subunit ribosomal protein L24